MTTQPPARILIVDDEGDLLQVMQFVLEDEGYEILTATNGTDAIRLVSSGPLDLVILDMSMPRMNGFEVAQQLRADAQSCRVAIAIHTALAEDVVRARFSDYDIYLRKVDDVSVLVESIRQVVEKGGSRQRDERQADAGVGN